MKLLRPVRTGKQDDSLKLIAAKLPGTEANSFRKLSKLRELPQSGILSCISTTLFFSRESLNFDEVKYGMQC